MELSSEVFFWWCVVFLLVGFVVGWSIHYLARATLEEPEWHYVDISPYPLHDPFNFIEAMRRKNMSNYPTYNRKVFSVEAVQVTFENQHEVADWCDGTIEYLGDDTPESKDDAANYYIKVDVLRPLHKKQTQAFIGDWVLKSGNGFKVYVDKAFTACFEPATDDVMALAEAVSE